MVDEAHISLPGTQPGTRAGTRVGTQVGTRVGWDKLLFEGNQVITKKQRQVLHVHLV